MDDINFSQLFHQSSKDHTRGHPPIPLDSTDWPEEWKTTYYKAYPRFPKIPFQGQPPKADFFDVIKKRKSDRTFRGDAIDSQELSIFLQYSAGITGMLEDGRKRRAQASGGARFPIEIYPWVLHGNKSVEAGIYHYNVKNHALDVMQKDISQSDIGEAFTYPWVVNASVVFLMTAVFDRSQNKYGERGYRYVLLEAGHIAQNMYLIAAALGLKCCALGGTRDQKIESLLDIDGVAESVVYAVAVGR